MFEDDSLAVRRAVFSPRKRSNGSSTYLCEFTIALRALDDTGSQYPNEHAAQTCHIPGTVLSQTPSGSYIAFTSFSRRIVWPPKRHSLNGSCHEAA